MIDAGTTFAKGTPSLKVLRISFRENEHSGINLVVADCVKRRFMYDPSEIFCYEDDGRNWDAWEEKENLFNGGPF